MDKTASRSFPTDTDGLTQVVRPERVVLGDGDHFDIHIGPVAKQINEATVRMLAYNGSIPGPTLLVRQGSTVTVTTTNDGDVDATVHWHGLRLENRYDGVPQETQAPIVIGDTYTADVHFPDPGFYWYHPHIREDFAQEMGLYGTIVVEPSDPDYWPAADRYLTITLDDVLIEDGAMAPFLRSGPTYTAMGRFGNVMLIDGETSFSAEASVGEVVRIYLVNTANTRLFNIGLAGMQMKLVGGDSGRYEHEVFVDDVLLAPSERMIVDVLFDKQGPVLLEHRAPNRTETIGVFNVAGSAPRVGAKTFSLLRTDPELSEVRKTIDSDVSRTPDKVLGFSSSMPLLYGGTEAEASSYVCPMHPEVTSTEVGTCPKCGMTLIPSDAPVDAAPPPHVQTHGEEQSDGLEWDDLMPDINRRTDPSNMIWKLIDRETADENHAIQWRFTVGDRVKIRLVNEMEGSDHPMHHPFHIHGAGRFLILSRDGRVEPNLVWKDTVLLRAGETVDILLHVTNPGLWMAHCHIAEHTESGMMFSFYVDQKPS
jgi:FtsP/CotA-like multicopper oxidase with cupredoxin domain